MKNKMFLYAFSIAVISMGSCNERRETTEGKYKEIERVEEWGLPVSEDFLPAYVGTFCYTVTFQKDAKDYLLGYNRLLHAIDILDLTEKRPYKQIQLQKEGKNQISDVYGVGFYKDEIVISSNTHYVRINLNGEVTTRIEKERLYSHVGTHYSTMNPGMSMFWMMYNFFFFDPETGEIGISFYNTHNESADSKLKILVVSCENWEIKDCIGIDYPDFIKKEHTMGVLQQLNLCLHNNRIIYNYPAASQIYVYDRKTGKTTEKDIPSGMMQNFFTPTEKGDSESSLMAGFFFPLQYDCYRNCYWRIQLGNKTSRKWWSERPYSISRISIDYIDEAEYEIPNDLELYCNSLFTRQGVLFPYMNARTEDDICFYLMKAVE